MILHTVTGTYVDGAGNYTDLYGQRTTTGGI
jgi:hypothetical protein